MAHCSTHRKCRSTNSTRNKRKLAAAVGAGFVGLISLFNIFGRIIWASSSDKLGRKRTYFVFFTLGAALYALASVAAEAKMLGVFVASFCIIASMYGGGFATIPAYLADMFGTPFVGAIHGRLLTAWSTAGILGPVVVNYLHDKRLAEQRPRRSDLQSDLLCTGCDARYWLDRQSAGATGGLEVAHERGRRCSGAGRTQTSDYCDGGPDFQWHRQGQA